jgi:hypothetical protein
VQSEADVGESEDGDGGDGVKQHRGDQSSRGAALRVTSRKPTCDTQRKQPGPVDRAPTGPLPNQWFCFRVQALLGRLYIYPNRRDASRLKEQMQPRLILSKQSSE